MKRLLSGLLVIIVILVFYYFVLRSEDHVIKRPTNVIVFLVDALRADRLGYAGYQRNTSPHLDELSKSGVIFSDFYAQTGWTLPSVASFFTGMFPGFHRVENYQDILNEDDLTLAEFLKEQGFKTVGLSANSIVCRDAGFAQGFDVWKNMDYDDCITRRTEAYIDPSIPNPEEIEERNLFDYSGFRYMYINKKRSHGLHPGYFGRGRFEIRADDIISGEPRSIVRTLKAISPGRYRWGCSLRTGSPKRSISLYLEERNVDGGYKTIHEEAVNATRDWEMYYFEIDLKKSSDLRLSVSIDTEEDPSGESVYIDTPFLMNPDYKKKPPLFIYLHYMEVHEPNRISKHLDWKYMGRFNEELLHKGDVTRQPGDPFNVIDCKSLFPSWQEESDSLNWHNNRYDETVCFIDDQVKTIIEALKRSGEFEETLFIFTSDHGQEFFDHGWTGHGYSLYDELLHIPLLMVYPDGFNDVKVIRGKSQSIDIYPTIAEILDKANSGSELEDQIMGRSLLREILGEREEDSDKPIFSSDVRNNLYSVIEKDWKYIEKSSPCMKTGLLFNMVSDLAETDNLTIEKSDVVSRLLASLNKYHRMVDEFKKYRARKTLPRDKLNVEKLIQLGYINPHYVTQMTEDLDCILLFMNITRYLFIMSRM